MAKRKRQLINSAAQSALYSLCNKKQYFTGGTNLAYDRMFEMAKAGKPVEVVASVIYACSNDEVKYEDVYRDVFYALIVDDEDEEESKSTYVDD